MKRREILRYSAYAAGFAVSAPIASAFFTSCKSDPEIKDTGYAPAFFTAAEYAYISKMADAMLPSDGTPGALDVGVPQMIDKMIGNVYSKENQARSRKSLGMLMEKMDADNPGGFSALEGDKALMYLQDQDLHYKSTKSAVTMSGEDVPQEEAVASDEATAKNAYFTLKSMIISSYMNTEEVATTMLAYDAVPGEYIPCGDLQELTGGKVWAL
ncbi:gluconate 2-dehydrogenase subunit 3 family protein [Neolewinella persica]|uniref:gluconate 2-dehydrogenase subunit 3 family protein n=1 Tax=Neolewinella persica TaxID=70998 RepID=UPI00036A49FD|nr:gluconate 2-dehydrogenase subunit 3 family protein [Neolewinella persica]